MVAFDKINLRKYDFHVHSNYTDGISSIEANVQQAIKRGLEGIAIIEHVRRESSWLNDYFSDIEVCREKFPNIKIYSGVETKVIDLSGNLDMPPSITDRLDLILGAVHRLPASFEEYRFAEVNKLADEEIVHFYEEALIALISNPIVDIVAHPFLFLRERGLDLGIDGEKRIVGVLKQHNKVIEVNARHNTPSKDFIALCLREGIQLCLGSDAHSAEEVGKFK